VGIPVKQQQQKICAVTLPDDSTSKDFLERLQAEFPECAELIESQLSGDVSESVEDETRTEDEEEIEEELDEEVPE